MTARASCQACGEITIWTGDRRCAYCDGQICQIDMSAVVRKPNRADNNRSRWTDITRKQVVDAYAQGHDIPEIAQAVYASMGYKNPATARAAIRQEFKRMRVGLRSPRECASEGCARNALTGSKLCVSHDPSYAEWRANHLAGVRVPYRAGEEHWKAKLWEEEVREIRASDKSPEDLASRFGVALCTIHSIQRGASWRHLESLGHEVSA